MRLTYSHNHSDRHDGRRIWWVDGSPDRDARKRAALDFAKRIGRGARVIPHAHGIMVLIPGQKCACIGCVGKVVAS